MEASKNNLAHFLLAALIEIYRGQGVFLPDPDPELEKEILMDVFSTAISFARLEESRQTLSQEIFKCSREGAAIKEEIEKSRVQTPDVLNAKSIAAAQLINIMNQSPFKLS